MNHESLCTVTTKFLQEICVDRRTIKRKIVYPQLLTLTLKGLSKPYFHCLGHCLWGWPSYGCRASKESARNVSEGSYICGLCLVL